MLKRALIRGLIVDALKAFSTLARDRVYSSRDWPFTQVDLPAIKVSTPYEVADTLGPNAPQYKTVAHILLEGKVAATAWQTCEEQAEALSEQMQRAVINSAPLFQNIEQVARIETGIEISAEGEQHIGTVKMVLHVQFYQGPEDFYPIVGDPFERMHVEVQNDAAAPNDKLLGIDIDIPQT